MPLHPRYDTALIFCPNGEMIDRYFHILCTCSVKFKVIEQREGGNKRIQLRPSQTKRTKDA